MVVALNHVERYLHVGMEEELVVASFIDVLGILELVG
jgi:hypothetical protein